MADEARITSNLTIRKLTSTGGIQLQYISQPGSFQANVTGTKGPVPGAMSVSVYGTNVDFSQLTTPALCRIMNLDSSAYLTYGIWDETDDEFLALGEVLPLESYVIRLSRALGQQYGTGTTQYSVNAHKLRLVSSSGTINAVVEAFET